MAHSRRRSRRERRVVRRNVLVALLACVLGIAVAAVSLSRPTTEHVAEVVSPDSRRTAVPASLLPDLDQETPRGLEIQALTGSRYALGFRSAVRNVGDGPLIIVGSRPDRRTNRMRADQLVDTVDGARRRVPFVGWLRYVVSPDHSHWHYLEFDRYELQSYELRETGGDVVVRDRKTGFCLGDRYRIRRPRPPNSPRKPYYTDNCGHRPTRLRVREGISVGYGDDYSAFLEGQSLPLNGLPDGRYLLIHRVNGTGGLQELSLTNNAASVLLALRWRNGRPEIQVLARCPASASCPLETE